MKLTQLRLSGFQSFGKAPTTITLRKMTYLLGPNGSGKTAVLQALARMFGYDPAQRRIRRTDFNVPLLELHPAATRVLWIEAQFEFPELKAPSKTKHPTIPAHFAHLQLTSADGVARMRFRLTATLDEDGEIEETFEHVLETDAKDEPAKTMPASKSARSNIQVHYLPARRDPSDHIAYTANSLLGRALRAADWKAEKATVSDLTGKISQALEDNAAIAGIGQKLAGQWAKLHKGTYYASPALSFEKSEIESLLRHLTVAFAPGHGQDDVDFSRLSDGQQSILYLSLVLAVQGIGRDVLAGKLDAFDVDKLRPAVFTLLAMEEPENSLSPHYLGRVVTALSDFGKHNDAQAIVATHAPSLLRRAAPENIRYLRLNPGRTTQVSQVLMPAKSDEAYKFVREAVQAFPELYFSRLVILGEGDTEEIVLPRLMQASGLLADDAAVSIAPLGGRHVNHFWRLLHGLGIPYITLLDLDLGRHQGGWGRVRYVVKQLLAFPTPGSKLDNTHLAAIPKWNSGSDIRTDKSGNEWVKYLETQGVFFSAPLDMDFAMMQSFAEAYEVDADDLATPDVSTQAAVLGKSHGSVSPYSANELELFGTYHQLFKLGSKPAAHLEALAQLDDGEINNAMPEAYERLIAQVKQALKQCPE